jgi:hypothetical protein
MEQRRKARASNRSRPACSVRSQAAHTDEIVASRDWDARSVVPDENTGQPIALRYVITHLIEETARHNGHLDILRELADGVTGV